VSALNSLSASEMARLIAGGEISPVELVEAHLSRIEALNPSLNAFVAIDREGARAAARRAESALRHGKRGPLHGVPITIKSSIDVAGLPCETGTRLRAGNVPDLDAPLVARLKDAGAIVLGNTNVPEMLMAYETDNRLYGRTNSPWALERTAGGSSGGEAAAIASGCSAAGIGSDGGGSIRVPAHFTGICGLKPTPGRIPGTGHFPACVGPFAALGVVGPMARTAADLRLILGVVAGPDNGDPLSVPVPLGRFGEDAVRRMRVGYFEDDGRTPVTPETRAAVRRAAKALETDGFEVVPFLPKDLDRAQILWWRVFGLMSGIVLNPMFADRMADAHPILQEFLSWVNADSPLSPELLLETLFERDQLRGSFLKQMESFPLILSPVCAVPAFRHGERVWMVDGKEVHYLEAMHYTQWFNLIGNPAAVVPAGQSPEGLPIGVQIIGRPFEEEAVLAAAEVLDRSIGGWREPPLAKH